MGTERISKCTRVKLADFPSETETELEADLMLGGDTFWPIKTSEFVHGPSKDQPVAVGTKFGWVLAGPVNSVFPGVSFHV